MNSIEFWTILIMNISILLLTIRMRLLEKDVIKLEKRFDSHIIIDFVKEYHNNDR